MKNKKAPNMMIFSGGNGNTALYRAVRPEIDKGRLGLSVMINGLDDGDSTGEIRRLFEYGSHGISDFLKVVLSLSENEVLRKSLSCRFPRARSLSERLKLYHELYLLIQDNVIQDYFSPFRSIDEDHLESIKRHVFSFLKYCYSIKDELVDIENFKVGNIVFASMLIKNSMDFDKTIGTFAEFCGLPGDRIRIVPNTDDIRFLAGLLKNGSLLPNEAAVVLTRTTDFIENIYQLSSPLTMNQIRKLCSVEIDEKIKMLSALNAVPVLSKAAAEIIDGSDLIVYGAGTPYSSILPSIETKGVSRHIAGKTVPKVMIANFKKECSNSVTVSHLISDLFDFLERSRCQDDPVIRPEELLTHVVVSDQTTSDPDFISVDEETISRRYPWVKIVKADILAEGDSYRHDGEKLLEILLSLMKKGGRNDA